MKNLVHLTNKRTINQLASASTLAIATVVISTSDAYAYVDPGSGSVIVTTILGAIAAIGYTFRKYFYKMRRLLRGKGAAENHIAEK